MTGWLLNFIFLSSIILSTEPLIVSFGDLESAGREKEGQEIRMRGFLYKQKDGVFILSSLPNVKSCCIGKNLPTQLVMYDFSESFNEGQAVTVQGILHVSDTFEEPPRFFMDKVRLSSQDSLSLFWGILGCAGLLLGLIYLCIHKAKIC